MYVHVFIHTYILYVCMYVCMYEYMRGSESVNSSLSKNKETAHVGTVLMVRVFEHRAAGQNSVCIRKVLRPATSITFSLLFLGPRTNSELVPISLVKLLSLSVALPKIIKIFAKTRPSLHHAILCTKQKFNTIVQLLSSVAYCQQSASYLRHLPMTYLVSRLPPYKLAGIARESLQQ